MLSLIIDTHVKVEKEKSHRSNSKIVLDKMVAAEEESVDRSIDPVETEEQRAARRKKKKKKHEK